VEEQVLVVVDEHAGVFAGFDGAGEGPGFEVCGPGHAGAVLLEEAPPLFGVVLVLEEVGVDHAAHGGFGDVGTFDAEELGLGPVDEVGAAASEDAGVGVGVALAVGARVGLQAHDPLVVEANDISGGGVFEVLVERREDAEWGPVAEIGALGRGDGEVGDAVGFSFDVGEEKVEDAVVVDRCGVAVGGGAVTLKKYRRWELCEDGREVCGQCCGGEVGSGESQRSCGVSCAAEEGATFHGW